MLSSFKNGHLLPQSLEGICPHRREWVGRSLLVSESVRGEGSEGAWYTSCGLGSSVTAQRYRHHLKNRHLTNVIVLGIL